jgi:hypothetical protein
VKKTALVQDPAPFRPTNKKNDDERNQNKATENQKPEKREDPVTRPSVYISDEKGLILKICLTLQDIYISHPPN